MRPFHSCITVDWPILVRPSCLACVCNGCFLPNRWCFEAILSLSLALTFFPFHPSIMTLWGHSITVLLSYIFNVCIYGSVCLFLLYFKATSFFTLYNQRALVSNYKHKSLMSRLFEKHFIYYYFNLIMITITITLDFRFVWLLGILNNFS